MAAKLGEPVSSHASAALTKSVFRALLIGGAIVVAAVAIFAGSRCGIDVALVAGAIAGGIIVALLFIVVLATAFRRDVHVTRWLTRS